MHKPNFVPEANKPSTAPTNPQTSVKPAAATSADEGTKKDPPAVPPRPRSVKAKLIKVALTESCSQDMQATYTIETEAKAEKHKQQHQIGSPICKITINGKESNVSNYNLKSKGVPNPRAFDNTNNTETDSNSEGK